MTGEQSGPIRIALIAGEHSGDHLGAALIAALNAMAVRGGHRALAFTGVGGPEMIAAGMPSIFPIEDIAVMGPVAIAARLPKLVRRVYQTVDHVVKAGADVLVIIDSPEFTHPIAQRVRKRAPNIPIVNYVSPSVWAWRPGRAKKMRGYIDHVLGLMPFEPKAHKDLGGPPCTYVGHPLIEKLDMMRTIQTVSLEMQLQLRPGKPVVVVLPGSRASEVKRLMQPFAATLNKMLAAGEDFETIIPAIPHLRPLIEAVLRKSGVPAFIVEGSDAKFKAFRLATCALAASGTVSLELALARTPMVIAYKVEPLATGVRYLIKADSVVLPNLILGANAIPEFLQQDCTPDNLCAALLPLLRREAAGKAQNDAFKQIEARMLLPGGQAPSAAAATIVADYAMQSARQRVQRKA